MLGLALERREEEEEEEEEVSDASAVPRTPLADGPESRAPPNVRAKPPTRRRHNEEESEEEPEAVAFREPVVALPVPMAAEEEAPVDEQWLDDEVSLPEGVAPAEEGSRAVKAETQAEVLSLSDDESEAEAGPVAEGGLLSGRRPEPMCTPAIGRIECNFCGNKYTTVEALHTHKATRDHLLRDGKRRDGRRASAGRPAKRVAP
jgi:hypothetical protein